MVIGGEPETIDASTSGVKATLEQRTAHRIAVLPGTGNTSRLRFAKENLEQLKLDQRVAIRSGNTPRTERETLVDATPLANLRARVRKRLPELGTHVSELRSIVR